MQASLVTLESEVSEVLEGGDGKSLKTGQVGGITQW